MDFPIQIGKNACIVANFVISEQQFNIETSELLLERK